MATVAMVKVVFGQALRWQRADLGLTWYKNDVSYRLMHCATHFPPGAHNLYKPSSIFFYHFKVNDSRRKLYTLMATNQF